MNRGMVFRGSIVLALLFCLSSSTAAVPPAFKGPPALNGRGTEDVRVRTYVAPTRIVWQSEDPQSVVEQAANLLKKDSGQVTLSNPTGCTLHHRGKAPGILLDFGCELRGGLQITVSATSKNQPIRLRVRFGESVSEAMSEAMSEVGGEGGGEGGGERNATNDHAI